ncbi:hypothetical protein RD1_A0081 (plasmid) [Roseobacter denitrificans OCh 114]|uniref:Uncharacterized protein n=1 Tax=Roseobacter denitrificans (strain ATCC 33942 / OCh 114) TaxID=375451 RepID=Q07GL9_ROSDO|nr:hypothetical protein RD1_A0081 [Roseobacter denitrificans OCh 114]
MVQVAFGKEGHGGTTTRRLALRRASQAEAR